MIAFEKVSAIALNTFRETVRDKIVYAFMLFTFIITLLSLLLGSLSVGQDVRILGDIGLAAISCIGGMVALFAGTNLVYKELERRTIYIIFTKPVSGWQFIAGKFIGLVACVFIVVAAMGLFLALLAWLIHPEHSSSSLVSTIVEIAAPVGLVFLELIFVTALATFFSTFSTPLMSMLFTLSLWLIGHCGDSLRQLGQLSQNPGFAKFSSVVYFLLPDLASLTRVRSLLLYGRQAGSEIIAYITCYVFAYVLVLLVLSSMITERKEFS